MTYRTRMQLPAAVLSCLYCIVMSSSGLAEEQADKNVSRLGHGYMLIRILGTKGEQDVTFEFTSQDSGYVVEILPDMCRAAGSNARLCMVILPSGRYFWSKYESEIRIGLEHSTIQNPAIRRDAPGSPGDTFEIVSGAINYVGDWAMKFSMTETSNQWARMGMNRRWHVDIDQDKRTLERLFEHFPEYASRYEIYLSMMGRKAISLQEFLRIVEEQSK